jgi:hypothetical protein
MSLCDDIATYKPKGCVTCNWYRTISDKERAAFDAFVTDFHRAPRSYPLSDLQDMCEPYGLTTNPRSFREHVQGHHGTR